MARHLSIIHACINLPTSRAQAFPRARRFFFVFSAAKESERAELRAALGPTTRTVNEKRKTLRKSRAELLPDRDMDIITG